MLSEIPVKALKDCLSAVREKPVIPLRTGLIGLTTRLFFNFEFNVSVDSAGKNAYKGGREEIESGGVDDLGCRGYGRGEGGGN